MKFADYCKSRSHCGTCRGFSGRIIREMYSPVCPLNLPVGATGAQIADAIATERAAKIVQVTVRQSFPKRAKRPPAQPISREQWPMPIRILARLAKPGEAGVGDTIHAQTLIGGADVIGWMLAVAKIPCGCADRKKWFNERFPYAISSPQVPA